MAIRPTIEAKLTEAFAPTRLEVTDQSHLHEGHAEAGSGGESHFHIEIVSAAFEGKSRTERHRLVYRALADELAAGLHALAITAISPGEQQPTGQRN